MCSTPTVIILFSCLVLLAHGFLPNVPLQKPITSPWGRRLDKKLSSTTSSPQEPAKKALLTPEQKQLRKSIFSNKGEYFSMSDGKVVFGSSSTMQMTFRGSTTKDVEGWLTSDKASVCKAIWDPSLMKDIGDNIYQLSLMQLQFVTIQFAPIVKIRIWTSRMKSPNGKDPYVLFQIQSIECDPNIQLLPNLKINAESLGIQVDVVGEMKAAPDGSGALVGRIGFQTSGKLTPALMLIPEPILKNTANTINKTILNFALDSFQKGAKEEYNKYYTKNS